MLFVPTQSYLHVLIPTNSSKPFPPRQTENSQKHELKSVLCLLGYSVRYFDHRDAQVTNILPREKRHPGLLTQLDTTMPTSSNE